jgi:hypothetical protein
MPMFVVVVNNPKGSLRSDGSLACWMGEDRDALISKALEMSKQWSAKPGYGPYEVLTGELTEKIKPVQEWEKIPIRLRRHKQAYKRKVRVH